MSEEEIMNINGIREDLYQAMQIGDITLNPKHSKELYDFMNYQDKEIERLSKGYCKFKNECNDLSINCMREENIKSNYIIQEVRNKCNYLTNNDIVEINGRTYIKQESDDIITNYIKETLDKVDKENK